MSDDDPYEADDQESAGRLRGLLEEANRARADAQAELTRLRQKDTFRDAGLDPSNPLHVAVMKGYDGELDVAQVREYVSGLNLPQPQQEQQPAPAPVPDDRGAQQRIAAATAGEGEPPSADAATVERVRDIRAQMDRAARRGEISEIDRLSIEYARLTGTDQVRIQPS